MSGNVSGAGVAGATAGRVPAGSGRLVVFVAADGRYGVELGLVERVIRAVAVRRVADLPAVVEGVMDMHGELVPVFNLRRRLGWSERGVGPEDQFLLVRTARRLVALVVERVEGVVEYGVGSVLGAEEIAGGGGGMAAGVVGGAGGLVVIQDVERFLTEAEGEQVERVLGEAGGKEGLWVAG